MSSDASSNKLQAKSSLTDLIELIKTTRQSFIIQDDLNALSSINNNIKHIQDQTTTVLDSKKKKIDSLKGKVKRATDKVELLHNNLQQSQYEAESFSNKDQLYKDYTKRLKETETSQEELRKRINTLTEELVNLQTSRKASKASTNPFNSNEDNEKDGDIYKQTISGDTLFDDIIVDEEDSADESDYSDIEKDPDYYKLEIFKSMDIVVDPDTKEVFISRKDGKVDVLSLEESRNEYFNTKFVWERLNKE